MTSKQNRAFAIFWCLFIGLGAVSGAVTMLIDPAGTHSGMAGLLPGLQKLPFAEVLFQNLLFSGISLLIVNGLTQLVTFVLILKDDFRAIRCSIGCGVVLMLWICIQFVIFPPNVLSTAYFLFGLLEAVNGFLWKRRRG